MADRALLSSSLFMPTYPVSVWLISSYDIVHRKNSDFATDAIQRSGFAKDVISVITTIPESSSFILGNSQIDTLDVMSFTMKFLDTNCTYHINYHDEKLCTVELVAKFKTVISKILLLDDELIERLHLEIETPVGDVQV